MKSRVAHWICLLAPGLAAAASPGARRNHSVLGDDGPAMADRVIAALTPGCPRFSTADEARVWSDRVRSQVIDSVGLDLNRKVISAEVQRTLESPEYRIEVARVEAFPGIYMPANIYIPNEPEGKKLPLVVTPIACNADSWSSRAQRRSANLARAGMVVIATDGFCGNGARATLPDSNRHVSYARQLLGMRGIGFSVFLQELISTITWALEHYPFLDANHVGAVGSSYGGQVALMLAQLDTRIRAVSVAGTYLGGPCDSFLLKSDIHMDNLRPPHVWIAPLEVPVLPVNWRLLTVFPRAVQVTSGEADMSAPPNVIGGAMAYARHIYALANRENQIAYVTDSGRHTYNASSRENARAWLSLELRDDPQTPPPETAVSVRSWEMLAPDISKTGSYFHELKDRIEKEIAGRIENVPQERVRANVTRAMSTLFGEERWPLDSSTVFEHSRGDVSMKGYRVKANLLTFPVIVFERDDDRKPGERTLLYLPTKGTQAELDTILGMLEHYKQVISIDVLGVGELQSSRLRLHTLARYLMYNNPSLPKINVELLRSYLASNVTDPVDIWATSWPMSFFATSLKWLEPERVAKVYVQGLPTSELRYLQSRKKIPDLLLWGGLYDKVSVKELMVAIGDDVRVVR